MEVELYIETDKEDEFIDKLDALCFDIAGINYHFEFKCDGIR